MHIVYMALNNIGLVILFTHKGFFSGPIRFQQHLEVVHGSPPYLSSFLEKAIHGCYSSGLHLESFSI